MKRTTARRIFRNILALYRSGYVIGRSWSTSGETPLYAVTILHVRFGCIATIMCDPNDHITTLHTQDDYFEVNRKAIEEIAEALADQFFAGLEYALV